MPKKVHNLSLKGQIMSDEFISSSRKDIEFAQRIHHELEARAHEPWLDWQDILPNHGSCGT